MLDSSPRNYVVVYGSSCASLLRLFDSTVATSATKLVVRLIAEFRIGSTAWEYLFSGPKAEV